MLEELAKKDIQWRQVAFSICKDRSLTDDLVQDMYLKAVKYNKPLNDAYIYFIIKSLFLDHCRKKRKNVSLEDLHFLKDDISTFEIDDSELEIINRYKKLDWKQQQLIEESYYNSLRQIEKNFPLINYAYAYRQIKAGIKTILGNDFSKHKNRSNNKNGRKQII
jgi:DNA-directed RNA polymerase specialized sigma24 family protein